jgi:predicted nucleic acid-binding protein
MAGAVSVPTDKPAIHLKPKSPPNPLPAAKQSVVLADASPLIGLSLIDHLHLLPGLFGTVWVSPRVLEEVLTGRFDKGEPEIRAALAAGWLQVCQAVPANMPLVGLDPGETQALLQACTLLQQGQSPLLLMDERAGRAAAAELGLPCVGTAAVIAMAKQKGLIPRAATVLERLFQTDFRLSKTVIRAVLQSVGEAL